LRVKMSRQLPPIPTRNGMKRPRSRGAQSPTLADVVVDRIADERDAVQKKVFKKWINSHITKVGEEIHDITTDLQDGRALVKLLELLGGETLVREKSGLRLHRMQNVQTCLNFLRSRKVKFVNIRSDEIVDGNVTLTLGLVWTIILHFQVSTVKEIFKQEQLTPKEALIIWCKELADGYPGVRIENFTNSWKDGLAFNAVIHRHRPDLIDYTYVRNLSPEARMEYLFKVAERDLGVITLLDPEDMMGAEIDEKAVLTYVSSLYRALPSVPPQTRLQGEQERQQAYFEYCNKAKKLITWIRNMISHVNSREFPTSLFAMKDIVAQHKFLKVEIMPNKDHERRSLKYLIRDLHAMYDPKVKFLDVADGLHPRVADELWVELLLAVEERTKALNIEYTRLQHLQRVAEKTEKEAGALERALEKIDEEANLIESKAEELGQGEVRRRHIQLDKALMVFEPTVKSLLANVEILLSGKYDEAEEIQIRVKNIASRWQVLKLRITTIIEKEQKVELKKSRLSGHQILVTRDTTISHDKFDSQVEVEPGVFVDAADLEGYNVQYTTTKTVVKVRSNVTEEEMEEIKRTEQETVRTEVTEVPIESENMIEEEAAVDGLKLENGNENKSKVHFLDHAFEISYVTF